MARTRKSTFTQKEDRIWTKIQVPFIIFLIFVVVVFLLSAYQFEKVVFESELADDVLSVQRMFVLGMEHDAAMMDAVLEAVSRNQEIKQLFLKRDRKALYARAKPLFDQLQREHRITHFYFTDLDRVNLLRVHRYERSGGRIDRPSMLRAVATGKETRGTELGLLGTFTLRVVLPWRDNGKIIGYLELGEEVGHIAESVRQVLDVGLLIIINKAFLESNNVNVQSENLKYDVALETGLVVVRAVEKLPPALIRYLNSNNGLTNSIVHILEGNKKLFVATLPLNEFASKEFGRLVVVRDVTSLQARFWNTMVLITVICLLAGIVVMYLFHVILQRIERDYQRKREVELQLSRVDQEHQRIVQVEKLSGMGLMVGEIAHQLNNPLVGVVNMAQLAERVADKPDRIRELLTEIRTAGKDCHTFVKRMLEFSKVSTFELKTTDLRALVLETVTLFRQSSGAGMDIRTRVGEEPCDLMMDPILVRHALFNLLSNAAQASLKNSAIEVMLEQTMGQHDMKPGWLISVIDQGEGIPEAAMQKLFTPFFTTRAEGTGLGLAVVQHVANVHRGFVRASNRDEGGALFAMWLPVQKDHIASEQEIA